MTGSVISSRVSRGFAIYLLFGILFGIVLIKSEVVSWFRIQEMFRFQSPRMYLIIGSAVATAAAGLQVIKRLGITTLDNERIVVRPKILGAGTRYWLGGTLFGLGWGIIGACPGPLFALLGSGVSVIIVPMGSAVLGTLAYGALRDRWHTQKWATSCS